MPLPDEVANHLHARVSDAHFLHSARRIHGGNHASEKMRPYPTKVGYPLFRNGSKMRAEPEHTPDMNTSAPANILRRSLPCVLIGILMLCLPRQVEAQVPPYLLRHSIPAPLEAQYGGNLGFSCAQSGNLGALGAPYDDTGAQDAGVVKIFDTTTGDLVQVVPNPTLGTYGYFGTAIAMEGARLVVGAPNQFAGASGAGAVYVYDLGGPTPTTPILTIPNPAPASYDSFGSALALSGDRLVVAAEWDDAGAADAGSAYVFDLGSGTPATPVFTLSNPNPAASDRFGISVAVDGDRVVVGVLFADLGASNAGRAYVYDLGGMTPGTPVLSLSNPAPTADAYFGRSVGISGQIVAVGAHNDRTGPQGTGSVHVYNLGSGTPETPVHAIFNPGPGSNEAFGSTLVLRGKRLLVGDFVENTGATASGTAYLYELASGSPTVPAFTFNNPNPGAFDRFSWGISLADDQVLIGAYTDDKGGIDAGTAYFYDLLSGTPTLPVREFNDPGFEVLSQFGQSVAVSGTLVAVGTGEKDLNIDGAGQVRIFDTSSPTPNVPVLTIPSPQPALRGRFGVAVALDGTRLVVGARDMNGSVVFAGAVYVYDLGSATPGTPVQVIPNPVPSSSSNRFGRSVALSGTHVVVGAPEEDTLAANAGSAYVFDLSSGTPGVPVLTLDHPTAGDLFGFSVGISGTRIIVGAHENDTGASNAGSAYVYDLASGTPATPVAALNNPTPASNDFFGCTVAIEGGRAVVGAYGDDTGAQNAGSVYVYDLDGATPTVPLNVINSPAVISGEEFGRALALSGGRLVVGAPGNDTGANNTGIAYVYNLAGASPTVPEDTLENPAPGISDNYGFSVAIHQQRIVVGAPLSDLSGMNQGAVHVFSPPSMDASLANLEVSQGTLMPGFAPGTTAYTLSLPPGTSSMTLTPTAADAGAVITVNGSAVVSGQASGSLPLIFGDNLISIVVTAEDGTTQRTHTLTVTAPGFSTLAFASKVIPVASNAAGSMAEVMIQRTGNLDGMASCTLTSADGSATAPAHYTAQSSLQVDFGDGQDTKQVQIPIAADAAATVARAFTITLADASTGVALGQPSAATVVILPPAAFTEKVKPVVKFTAPANNAVVVDTVPVTVSGMATDNIGIHKVQVSLNNGPFVDANVASPGGTSTEWNLNVTPAPGKNTLKVRSVDFKGNLSSVISRGFTHLRTLTVAINGPAGSGTVSTGFMPSSKRIAGKSYSITATPKPGFVFDGWTASDTAGTGITVASAELPKLAFIMQPGLSLTAKFIVNPFDAQLTGTYRGLVRPDMQTDENNSTAGLVHNVVVTSKGAFSGSLLMDGAKIKLAGFFDNTGDARFGPARSKTLVVTRKNKPVMQISLHLDMTGFTHRITGGVDQLDQSVLVAHSDITADRAAFGKLTEAPAALASKNGKSYTLVFAAKTQTPAIPLNLYPQGHGHASVIIKSTGAVTLSGKLADGTIFTSATTLSKHLQFPAFAQLYQMQGSFGGEITVADAGQNADDLTGVMFWFRPQVNGSQWYQAGWPDGIGTDALGNRYTVPSGSSVFPGLQNLPANADLSLSGGLLAPSILQDMLITPANKVSPVPAAALPTAVITAKTGGIAGKFRHSLGASTAYQGVILQKGTRTGAHGWFLSPKPAKPDFLGESGAMRMTAK